MARGARSLSTRTAGLLLALAFALIAAGVILVVVVRGQGSGAGLGSASSDLGVPVRPPESGRGVQGARDTRVQFADRHDPSRVASELQWATLDPRERGRADVTEPRAWVYFKDGRVGHVKAQRGQLYMPEQGKHPETGTFVGGVLGRVFGPRPPGDTRPIDPETDTPEVLFFAETIEFNMPMGSITTSDEFRVESSEVTFRARGLVLHWNEVRDRVELFQTDGNNSLQYVRRPGATNPMQHRAPPAPESASVPGTGPAGAAAQAPRAPRLDFYKAVLAGHVELAQNQRLLTSDNLDLWVRLVDRRLAPGALGPATPQAPGSAGDGAAPPPPPPAETGAELAPAPADAPTGAGAITLSWSGPLTVRPMEAAPPELARDDVALRFTADGSNTVGLRDTAAGLTGACAWLAYGATSRLVTLAGRGPVDVRLADARGSAIESDRVEIAVAARTAHVPGAGRLLRDAGSDRAGAAPPAITWREQADFVFEPGAGTDSWRLREALLAGSVAAQDGPRALRGESFHAYFAPAPDGRPLLGRLVIQEQAVADGQSAGSLRASRIDI
ncbi:MAG TPA: hypothetical protein VD963_10505, partial [Phycisphaerales bacterium]|nr:hypothetical protein [Phycisphaerales bacterium]